MNDLKTANFKMLLLRNYKLYLFIGIAFSFIACTPATNDHSVLSETTINNLSVTEINLDAISEEVIQIGLSDFFEDFDVILLENRKEALATNATIHLADTYFLLGTQNWPGAARLLRFDYDGNFLNAIGKEGKGPGEHLGQHIIMLEYFKEDNSVMIDWGGFGNPQLFKDDGTHLKDIRIPKLMLSNIYGLSKDEWFSVGSTAGRYYYERDSLKAIFYASDGSILKKIKRSHYPPEGSREYTPYGNASVFSFEGQKKVYFPGDHTIYRIENRQLIPEAVIRPGKNILPFNGLATSKEIIGSHYIEILSETERNWFIKKSIYTEAELTEFPDQPGRWGGRFDTKEQLIVIDKKSNKGKTYEFKDDLLYILPKEYIKYLSWQEGFGAYFALSPFIYLQLQESSESIDHRTPEVIRKLEVLDDLTQDDNFIVFTFPIREEYEIN